MKAANNRCWGMNRKKWNNCKFEWCCLGILIALELIMSSTFLGYIHVPPISVATAYIPVVVMAVRNSAVRVCRTDLWVWQYV